MYNKTLVIIMSPSYRKTFSLYCVNSYNNLQFDNSDYVLTSFYYNHYLQMNLVYTSLLNSVISYKHANVINLSYTGCFIYALPN